MKQKVIVPELIIIRAVSCLAVVLMHSITMLIGDPEVNRGLNTARLLLLFATPTFAYMSAFLIGYSKSQRPYFETLWLRVKYLILPYLIFAVGYACWQHYQWGAPLVDRIRYNIVAATTGTSCWSSSSSTCSTRCSGRSWSGCRRGWACRPRAW